MVMIHMSEEQAFFRGFTGLLRFGALVMNEIFDKVRMYGDIERGYEFTFNDDFAIRFAGCDMWHVEEIGKATRMSICLGDDSVELGAWEEGDEALLTAVVDKSTMIREIAIVA